MTMQISKEWIHIFEYIYIMCWNINIVFFIIDVRYRMKRLTRGYLMLFVIFGLGVAPIVSLLYIMFYLRYITYYNLWDKWFDNIVDFLAKEILNFENKNEERKK